MLELSTQIAITLKDSKQVLFLMHEYLPLPLALWVPTVVSLLKKQGKDITVLVSQEMLGWPKRVDEIYPTDMVLSLEQLRQVISVPITNKSETIGDVFYDIVDGNLQITVVPVKETLDMTHMKTVTHGKTYDAVVGVGVSANHSVLQILEKNQASLSKAKAYFVGTYALQSVFASKLPFIPTISVVEKEEDKTLREIVEQLTENAGLESMQRETVTLFVQSIMMSAQQHEYLDKEGYEYLAKIADASMDSGRMASLYSGDFITQNRIVQQILQSAQKSSQGETILFTVTQAQKTQLGVPAQDIVTALYYLPKYQQVKQVLVVIEDTPMSHHVFVNGDTDVVKQVAIKFGFPKTDRLTGGLVEGISIEKLVRDLTRMAAKEEFLPPHIQTYSNTNIGAVATTPMTEISAPVAAQTEKTVVNNEISVPPVAPAAQVSESPSIPMSPSLDEVLQRTSMNEDAELDSGEIIDIPSVVEMPVEASPMTPPPSFTPIPPAQKVNKQPTGLDFAAIAKKMRESIT